MPTYDCPKGDFRLIETNGMTDPRAEMIVSNALVDGVGNDMPITLKATQQGLVHELPGRMWRCKGRA